MAKKHSAKKNTKMRRTVLGTLSAVFMASALIVAAIPSSKSEAAGGDTVISYDSLNYYDKPYALNPARSESKDGIIARQRQFETRTVDDIMPSYSEGTRQTTPVFMSEDGLFSVAYARMPEQATFTGVIVNFDITNPSVSSTLTIPENILAYQYDIGSDGVCGSGTNLQAVCGDAVGYDSVASNPTNYLYYIAQEETVTEGVSDNAIETTKYIMEPCYASYKSRWFEADENGNNAKTMYQRDDSVTSGLGVILAEDGHYYKPSTLIGGQMQIDIQYIGSTRYNPNQKVYKEGVGVFQDATQISTLKIGSNILAIGNNAFINCQFNSVSLGNKIQRIGDYAFYNCNMLRNLNLYDESDRDGSAIHATTALNVIGACAFAGCTSLQSVVMPDQVQSVGMFCFANDVSLVSANLYGLEQDGNTSLTKVGDGLFLNCNSLQVLHISDAVSNIDYVEYMLYDCSSLYELYLPNNSGGISNVSTLSGTTHTGVFAANNLTGCSSLRTIKVPNNLIALECGVGTGLDGEDGKYDEHDDNSTYPHPITGTSDIDAVGRINLGCHLSHPEEYAISNAFVILGNRSESSQSYKYARAHGLAFGYTENGTEYYEKISENYFYTIVKPTDGTAVAALSKISIEGGSGENIIIPSTIGPYTIGSISSEAFAGLEDKKANIYYVNIPYSVREIGDNTFNGCTKLEAVHFDDAMAVEVIGNKAFYTGAGVSSPELKFIGQVSSGEVESVPFQYAMTVGNTYNDPTAMDATYITYCTEFPSNLQIKLEYELNPVDNTIMGATPTLIKIPKGVNQYKVGNSIGTISDYSLTPYEAERDEQNALVTQALDKYSRGVAFNSLTEAEQNIITATTVLNVPYGVRAIADEDANGNPVLAGNEDLLTIQFNSIEYVQDKALDGCKNLVNFSMKTSNNATGEAMGNYVFENCPALTNVSLPETFTSFGKSPFHGATTLTYVDFGNSPYFTCDNYIIYGLDTEGNKSDIIECLRVRGKTAGTSFITNADFAGISAISPYAFYDCDGILTADMSSSNVAKIPENCFDSCINLYECTLPDATTEIESCAFKDTKIRSILIPNTFAHISDTAFVDSVGGSVSGNAGESVKVKDVDNLIIKGYSPSTAENYANSALHPTFFFEEIKKLCTVTFIDNYDNQVLHTESVPAGSYVSQVTWAPPTHEGVLFKGWDPAYYYENPVTDNMTVKATYEDAASATYTITFEDYDGTVLYKETVIRDGNATAPPITPHRSGYSFIGWDPSNYNSIPITKNMTVTAQYYFTGEYDDDNSGDNTNSDLSGSDTNNDTTSSSSSSGGTKKPSSDGSSSSDSNNSSNSSNSSTSSDSNNSTTQTSGNKNNNNSSGSVSGNSGTINKRPSATNTSSGTKVDVSKTGISNKNLVTANVSGGNGDNYVIKITDSESAKSAVQQALLNEYGSLDSIKYFAMDISLYDATGTTKLENVSGISVNITMPIPEALVTYGGNNMAGAVSGTNTLEKLATRFTTIDGVPCMSFTATHFSPYTIYVDTNNLTATGTADITPKTGDPIAPKWFLSIGLALLSIVTFFMRGSKRKVVKIVS